MSAETKVPSIPSVKPENLAEVARAIKMLLEVREGQTGDPLDANVTFRDLVKMQVAKESPPGSAGAGGLPARAPTFEDDGYNPEQDFTVPPRPENLQAFGGLGVILLQWNPALYRNHSYTEIWRSEEDSLGNAVKIGTSDSQFYSDTVGSGKSYFYWVRFVSAANVIGPYNQTEGTLGETSQDPAYLLELLTGQITKEQLFEDLSTRIDMVDENTSAIAVQEQYVSGLRAQYTVKIDLNGYVTGYGLAATYVDDEPTSSFAVRADQFYVAPPTNFSQETTPSATAAGQVWYKTDTKQVYYSTGTGTGSWVLKNPTIPFVVRTTATTINGVSVPAGVYIDDAYIANGTITNAKIGNAVIDSAKISSIDANLINAGALKVGGYIQSTNYSAGTAGWRINADGSAEFSNVTVRGAVVASSGSIGSATINSTGVQSTNYVAGVSGWRLNASGSAEFRNVVVRGDVQATSLNAATGTFTGSLSGATGTFAGSLSAATGTFSGSHTVGTAAVSGSTMTGSGGVINSDGTFAFGNSTKNLSFNGGVLTMNGDLVVTGNIVSEGVTATRSFLSTSTSNIGGGSFTNVSMGGTTVSVSLTAESSNKVVITVAIDAGVGTVGASSASAEFRVTRNGTALSGTPRGEFGIGGNTFAFTFIDESPAAGTNTYVLQAKNTGSSSVSCVLAALVATAFKR